MHGRGKEGRSLSGTEGFGLTGLSGSVAYNLDTSQARLQSDVSRLSSGLRITTAADDPSGLAIAEGLQAKILGYEQASSNVQDANNALTVADGALQAVTDILQRLRSLAVEANDGLISTNDRSDLQTEVGQLTREIDAISQNTTFNGVSLLNGTVTYATSGVAVADSTFSSPNVGAGSNAFSYQYQPVGASWTFSTTSTSGGAGITAFGSGNQLTKLNTQSPPSGASQVGFVQGDGSLSQSITGFSTQKSYALTFSVAQRAEEYPNDNNAAESFNVLVGGSSIGTYTPIATNPYDPNWTSITTNIFGPSTATENISFQGNDPTGVNMLFIDDVNISAVNAGKILSIQCGAVEGDALNCQLPNASAAYLGISTISLLSSVSATAAETQIDSAIALIDTARAGIGAQMVRLQEQGSNDSTSFVNLTASESAIRDCNISAATIDYASAQILSAVGMSLLSNVKILASSVEKLFQ
jgi:flagellin